MFLEVLMGEKEPNGIVKTILQMQPMPDGCYLVNKTEATDVSLAAITELDPVLFIAIFNFDNYPKPVQCYGIQETGSFDIVWRPSEDVHIYAYGPYKATCKLLGQTALDFASWYHCQGQNSHVFDIPVRSFES